MLARAPAVALLCETHVAARAEIDKWQRLCGQAGYLSYFVPAFACGPLDPAKPRANSGGLCALIRKPLSHSPVPSVTHDAAVPAGAPCRWAAFLLRVKSVSYLVVAVYLKPSEGLSAENLAALQQVFVLIRTFGCPVVLAGDFNCSLETLLELPWFRSVALSPLVQSMPTCLLGQRHT